MTKQGPAHQEGEDENPVDQRNGRAIEVVVVRGHELADLVDERAKTESGDDGRGMLDRSVEKCQQEHQRQEHQQAAPQHVRDVDPVRTDLWVAGESKEPADPQERADSGDQEALVQERRLGIPGQAADRESGPVDICALCQESPPGSGVLASVDPCVHQILVLGVRANVGGNERALRPDP